MERIHDQVHELDAGKRRDQPAQAVDQKVAPQQHGGPKGRKRTPRKASGISAMMMSALKITALRMALRGD